MLDLFLFAALPYVAVFSLVAGSVARYRMRVFSYSSLSTQFLENRWLAWASLPWHIGIIIILLGHVVVFLFPGVWAALVTIPAFLLGVEALGVLCALLCLAGLTVLLARRFVDAKLQAVTSYLDVAILLILLFQVSTGLTVALRYHWGAVWAPGAIGPYLHSVMTFRPDTSFMKDMPPLIKVHVALAWVFLMLFPFTRLVHALSLPLCYFTRRPQKVVWNNSRAAARFEEKAHAETQRRLFLKAVMGLGGAAAFLSMGTMDKLFRYFLKQNLAQSEEEHLLSKKLQRLKQTAEERELELERLKKSSIFVAKVSDLSRSKGKYFIDYLMRPGLAFVDENGLPIVLSAKCTHLGCTVGQDVDDQGRILCPCHISYFDLKTGEPNPGAPAKLPLPHLPWAVRDEAGSLLLAQDAKGRRDGTPDSSKIANGMLFIVKPAGLGSIL